MAGVKSRFVLKAFIAGLIVFAVLRVTLIILLNQTEPVSFVSGSWFQILSPIVAGYVAGYVAKHDGFNHGALVGAGAPVIEAVGYAIITLNISVGLQMLGLHGVGRVVLSVLSCGLGGFIWDVQSKFRGRAP